MNYYNNALRNYSNFSGRARRSEYWYFNLINAIFSTVILMSYIISNSTSQFEIVEIIIGIYELGIIIPSLAVSVRRMHDIGKSGWLIFTVLIPIIGTFWFLVLTLTDSQPGENKWGPNPKELFLENR